MSSEISPFQNEFEYDVFISYSHFNNHDDWVGRFHEKLHDRLREELARQVRIFRDVSCIRGNEPLTPEILHAVQNSAVLLVVVSQAYLQSSWCTQERREFLAASARHSGPSLIFPVLYEDISLPDLDAEFHDLVGYKFFSKAASQKYCDRVSPDSSQFRTSLNELRIEIARKLGEFKSGPRMHGGHESSHLEPELNDRLLTLVDSAVATVLPRDKLESAPQWVVARFLALFDRVCCEAPNPKELLGIAEWIGVLHPAIGLGDVVCALAQLGSAGFIEKGQFLRLAAQYRWHLWEEWWNHYGAFFELQKVSQLPGNLPYAFATVCEALIDETQNERLEISLAVRLLRFDPWFHWWEGYSSNWASRLFTVLSDAAPVDALQCVQRLVRMRDSRESLKSKFSTCNGRWAIVEALCHACNSVETVSDALLTLRTLAKAEGKDGEPATKAFVDFFLIADWSESAIEMPPAGRFLILDQLLRSPDRDDRWLGLKAFRSTLDTYHQPGWLYMRARQGDDLTNAWRPKSKAEIIECHWEAWNRLCLFAGNASHQDEVDLSADILGRALFGFLQSPTLAERCLDTLTSLASKRRFETKPMIETLVRVWARVDSIPSEVRLKIRILNTLLTNTFESRLHRFVGMAIWDDQRFDNHDREPLDNVADKTAELAREVKDEPALLPRHLDWLMTKAERPWDFGRILGEQDPELLLWNLLTDTQKKLLPSGNAALLGGYMAGIRVHSEAGFASCIRNIFQDLQLKTIGPELVFRSGGLTDDSTQLLTSLLECGDLAPIALEGLLYEKTVSNLSEEDFLRWMKALVNDQTPEAIGLCISFLYRRYKHESATPVPTDFIESVISDSSVFALIFQSDRTQKNHDYEWGQLLEILLQTEPDRAVNVVAVYFRSFGKEGGGCFHASRGSVDKSVYDVLAEQPQASWSRFFDVLADANNRKAGELLRWLRGDEYYSDGIKLGLWPQVPQEMLFSWIEQQPEVRVGLVAPCLPPLVGDSDVTPITRSFLLRYDSYDEVMQSLIGIRSIQGPYLEAYQRRLDSAIATRALESDPIVLSWIDRHMRFINARIEWQKQQDAHEADRLR